MTEQQKRLRQESGKKSSTGKVKKEKLNYTQEQYDNRIVFGKLISCFTPQTFLSIYIKSYFTDKAVTQLVVVGETKEDVKKEFSWLALYKVNYCYVNEDNILVVNLMRKYSCTADEYFQKLKNRKGKEDDC